MTEIKLSFQRRAVVATLSLTLFTNNSPSIQSQPLPLASSDRSERALNFTPPPPPSVGAPTGRRKGGASRGSCQKYEALTAIVPLVGELVWGLTVAERPTFWFFLPEPLTAEFPVEFVVQDEADNYVYKTSFRVPETQSGVVSLFIPPTSATLESGKLYRWSFSIYCDRKKPSTSVFVQGSVQRVSLDPTLQRQLETAIPREQVALYAANGIWYDALTNLVQLRQTHPEDASLIADWKSLLESVGLQAIAQQPIVQCCKPEK
jgi:hypothetical protein